MTPCIKSLSSLPQTFLGPNIFQFSRGWQAAIVTAREILYKWPNLEVHTSMTPFISAKRIPAKILCKTFQLWFYGSKKRARSLVIDLALKTTIIPWQAKWCLFHEKRSSWMIVCPIGVAFYRKWVFVPQKVNLWMKNPLEECFPYQGLTIQGKGKRVGMKRT